ESTGNDRFSPPFSFFNPRVDRSGIISYEYEKREKFEDYNMRADAELGTRSAILRLDGWTTQ
ncbi:hypothetical protein PIB30_041037, partial [Stylosanthes scabra]|nr:hypothetical protein [Stylosanthes scabra]